VIPPALGLALAVVLGVSILCAPGTMAQADSPEEAPPPYKTPYLIPLEEEIDDWNFTTFKRRVDQALEAGADLIVVPLDTPGGELHAAFNFGKYIFNKVRPRARVAFYITNHALSAGALIALSGHEIVMGPGGTIGDCQPIFLSTEGIKEGPEKIQSPLRATFRKYARANDYPEALAESMVTKELEILQVIQKDDKTVYVRADKYESWTEEQKKNVKSKEVVVKEGELLTMTTREAVEFGFARAEVHSLKELGLLFGLEDFDRKVKRLEPSWSEDMVKAVQAWNILFVLIGLLCLYLEFKTPGFGFFGIAGIVAFAVYFFFGYLTGLSNYWEIALCLVGVILIGLEIFVVPGTGFTGILGIVCVLVGLFAGGLPNEFIIPRFPYQQVIFQEMLIKFSIALGTVLVLAYAISKYLPDIPVFNKLILTAASGPPHSEAVPGRLAAEQTVTLDSLGTALTALRPTGTARFGPTRVDVVTQGEFLEKNTPLRVIQTSGYRIVVVEDTTENTTNNTGEDSA